MNLGQYFTPRWAAEALYERHFSHLGRSDIALDPCAGRGAFLQSIPDEVPAFGVEIDPALAAVAQRASGRHVIVGDFRTVPIAGRCTAVIGNPPFTVSTIAEFLQRSFELLEWEGQCGFILPCYVFQTTSQLIKYHARWSMQVELLPRTLFKKSELPLLFAMLRKTHDRKLVGFALYEESRDIEQMPENVQRALQEGIGRRSAWRDAVSEALRSLSGEGTLDCIYAVMEPRRPSGTKHWREKVRQVLQKDFRRVDRGRYALPIAA